MTTLRSIAPLLACLAAAVTAVREASAQTFAYGARVDGDIAAYRVEPSGELKPLPTVRVTSGVRPLILVPSANGRFLYVYPEFDTRMDGYIFDERENTKRVRAAQTKLTPVTVFAVGRNGILRRVNTVAVPAPVGQLVPHPGGKFVYALTASQKAILLRVLPRGGLTRAGSTPIESGMSLLDMVGERDAWGLAFSPNGSFLYDFRGDGFVDHSENYLHRYRVNRANGRLTMDGDMWSSAGERPGEVGSDPGMVREFVNNTAFVKGFAGGIWVARIDGAGRIVSAGSRLALVPKGNPGYGNDQTLVRHPKLPVVVYRGSDTDPYTVWRVTAPGKIAKAGTFPTAFPKTFPVSLYADPSGRFLYEVYATYPARTVTVATFAWDKTGTKVTRTTPPRTLPNVDRAEFVFVATPGKR
jgi:hypothetical protein